MSPPRPAQACLHAALAPAALVALALLLPATPARAALGLGLWGDVPGTSLSGSASSTDPGWQAATHIGGHLGLSYDPQAGWISSYPPAQPTVYFGRDHCSLGFVPCSLSDVQAHGSVNAQYGSLHLYARVQTPSWGYHAAGAGAWFTDSLTMAPASAGLTLRFTLDASHSQQVQVPESSFPGGDYQFSLTLRRPDSAAPPGCGSGEFAPPCEQTFFEMRFWSYWDVPQGRSAWAWAATGFDADGLAYLSAGDSGLGNGTSFELFMRNPQQPAELRTAATVQADCVRSGAGNCRVSVDASHSAYVQFIGDFQSASGYQYLGTTAPVPEPATALLGLAGLGLLGGVLRRRRPQARP